MDTSWNKVADWYDEHLSGDDTYHAKVVLPNLLRVLAVKKGDKMLDLACGQGYFSRAFQGAGAKVIGIDSAPALIEKAKKQGPKDITYKVATSDRLDFLSAGSLDKIACVLAIQNIENIASTFDACAKALKEKGTLVLVMNHPAFRIPKASSWGWQEGRTAPPYAKATEGVQYRRIDSYLTESKATIDMTPGAVKDGGRSTEDGTTTVSYHRPLQVYFKTLANAGFAITRLEEWISHRESEKGPRKGPEDKARKEFPLFLMLEAKKLT